MTSTVSLTAGLRSKSALPSTCSNRIIAAVKKGWEMPQRLAARGSDVITPVFATQPALSTHARKPNLLPLVQRLIEARERGTDRGGGCLHRGEPSAEGRHASDRSERGFGRARAGERVGGFK